MCACAKDNKSFTGDSFYTLKEDKRDLCTTLELKVLMTKSVQIKSKLYLYSIFQARIPLKVLHKVKAGMTMIHN